MTDASRPPSDDKALDALLDALAREASAQLEDPLADPRVEALAAGDQNDDPWLANLATQADVDDATIDTALTPLSDAFLDGLVDTVAPVPANVVPLKPQRPESAPTAPTTQQRWQRWGLAAGLVAAAAAIVLMVLPGGPPPIADYAIDRLVGVSATRSQPSEAVRLSPGGSFKAVLRPSLEVEPPVAARAWLKHAEGWVALSLESEVAASGSIQIQGTLPPTGLANGPGELVIVVGRTSVLPANDATEAQVRKLASGGDSPLRVLTRQVLVESVP